MKSVSKNMFQKVLDFVQDGIERTCPEIARLTGLPPHRVGAALHILHNEGKAYIARWEYQGANSVRVWKFGSGVNATKRKPLTKKEKNQIYRKRALDAEIKKDRAKLDNFIPFRHPLDEIFFGPWTKPVQPSDIPRRAINRFVEIVEEEVEA